MRTVSLTWCLLRYTLRKSVHTESIVCLSTVPPDFNINEIVNLNKKVKSKTRKVAKAPQLTKAAASKTVKDPNHESPKLKAVPECFSFVLDMPLYSGMEVDQNRALEFREVIEELNINYLPSVSTIITQTQPSAQKAALDRWQKQKTKELGGEEQFEAYKQEIFDTGSSLHKAIELRLQGETEITVSNKSGGHWESVQRALGEVSDVKVIETACVHQDVFYQGKFDCVAKLRDTLCLIEWKTSSKPKPLLSSTYDNPLQVAAYIGAVNRSQLVKQCQVENITNGALVIAYPSGEPATVHMMSKKQVERYWARWNERLFHYWCQRYAQAQEMAR
ncbi:mitochondrial genome maintenance exonuclease 1-like [Mya arenaria]|uniref:mitochondrial genome maintenance exonuclease 1-like n=1 Tax=Mya arenaria TaxID=6604 RepID=UPI0022E864FD|nr:mitochondrial genome maintenance exonuclease 1-like [Mya arenaria]